MDGSGIKGMAKFSRYGRRRRDGLEPVKKRFSPETEFRVCRERMPSDENILRLELTKAMHALLIVGIPLVAIGVELALAIVVGRALKYGLGNFNRTE